MAKMIDNIIQSRVISNYYSVWRIVIIGLVLGVIDYCMTAFISHFTNSLFIAGNVATIITATVGIVIMVQLQMIRPIIIASATAISLWGLASFTSGLWWGEVFCWYILLYILAYVLFSWLCRYTRAVPVLFVVIVIVVLVRIIMNL